MDPNANDCDRLEVGDFYFLAVYAWPTRSDNEGNYLNETGRHGEVALFGWKDIPPGVPLYLTDRAWSDYTQSFVPNNVKGDGIVSIVSPAKRGFPAGMAFGLGNNTLLKDNYGTNWTDVDVDSTSVNTSQYFQLGRDGDQVFFYCTSSDGRDKPLAAFSYNGPFLHTNTTPGLLNNATFDYGTNTSAAPEYFYEPAAEELNNTDPTPGMMVMFTPSTHDGTGGKMCLSWDFACPFSAGGSNCKMDFYTLRNEMQDDARNWIGSNPDASKCLPSAASLQHHWMANGLGALCLLLWLLIMV